MQRLGFLVLFLGLTLLGISAPTESAKDSEYVLEKAQVQPMDGDESCGPYFILTTYGGRSAERIVFHFVDENGKVRADTIKPPMVSVIVGDKDKDPTIRFEKNDDGERTMILRISPKDKQEAPCLSKAKSDNTKGGR